MTWKHKQEDGSVVKQTPTDTDLDTFPWTFGQHRHRVQPQRSPRNYIIPLTASDTLYLISPFGGETWNLFHSALCCFVIRVYVHIHVVQCPQCVFWNPPEQSDEPSESTRTRATGWQWNKDPRKWIQRYHTEVQRVPTGGESNKTIQREVGLICVQPSESSLVTVQQGALN